MLAMGNKGKTMNFKSIFAAAAVACAIPGAGQATSVNLIENGGFEDLPILTAWDCDVSSSGNCAAIGGLANSGLLGGFVFDNVGVGALSQTFATAVGTTYDVVFFLATNKVNTPETNVFSYGIADAAPDRKSTRLNSSHYS